MNAYIISLSRYFLIALLSLSFLFPSWSLAQEAETTSSPTPEPVLVSEENTLIANINIHGGGVKENSGREISFGFTIMSSLGLQNNVRYGVELYENTVEGVLLVDQQVFDEVLTLAPDDYVYREAVYVPPGSVTAGGYELRVVSRTESGISLAAYSLGVITLTTPQIVSTLSTESCSFATLAEGEVVCVIKNSSDTEQDITVTARLKEGDIFGQDIGLPFVSSLTVPAKGAVSYSLPAYGEEPFNGIYTVNSQIDTKVGLILSRESFTQSFGKVSPLISNLFVLDEAALVLGVVVSQVDTDSVVTVMPFLQAENCPDVDRKLEAIRTDIVLASGCEGRDLFVSLIGSDGTLFDSETITIPAAETPLPVTEAQPVEKGLYALMALVGLILLGLLVLWLRERKSTPVLLLLLLPILSLWVPTNYSEAATVSLSARYNHKTFDRGYITARVNIAGADQIQAGDTYLVTGNMSVTANGDYLGEYYHGSEMLYGGSCPREGSCDGILDSHGISDSFTLDASGFQFETFSNSSFVAPAQSGNYNLGFGGGIVPMTSPDITPMTFAFASLPVTVTASPQCSDGVNNGDGDGLIDSADPSCHSDCNAGNAASYLPNSNNENLACTPPPPSSVPTLLICPTSVSLTVGGTADLEARYWANFSGTPNCSTGAYSVVTTGSTWSSNNSSIASVSNSGTKGRVTGVALGSATALANYLSVSANSSITVTSGPTAPVVNLNANPNSIYRGASSTLSWSVQNATACSAYLGWSGNKTPVSNGSEVVSPTNTTTYGLSCTGPGGTTVDTVTVQVTVPPPAGTIGVTISASPSSIPYSGEGQQGGQTSISWTVAGNATSCEGTAPVSINGNPYWNGAKAFSPGQHFQNNIFFDQNTNVTITCQGPGGPATSSVLVLVSPPPIPAGNNYLFVCPASVSVPVGSNTQLQAYSWTNYVGTPSCAISPHEIVTADPGTVWASDATAIATVSNTLGTRGQVNGVANGTANVSATYSGLQATSLVTVGTGIINPPPPPVTAKLLVCPSTASVNVGSSTNLSSRYWTATTTSPTCDTLGYNIVTGTSAWTVPSGGSNASVNSGGVVTGTVAGNATVNANYLGIDATAAITVNIVVVPGPRLILCPASPPNIGIGGNTQLEALYWSNFNGTPDCESKSPTTVTSDPGTSWSTDDVKIAGVSNSGLSKGQVIGNALGTTIIRATYSGLSAGKNITVTDGGGDLYGKRLIICPDDPPEIQVGSTTNLKSYYWENASSVDCSNLSGSSDATEPSGWSSGSTNATVNKSGGNAVVTGVNAGLTLITASHNNLLANRQVTISGSGGGGGLPPSITLSVDPKIVRSGETAEVNIKIVAGAPGECRLAGAITGTIVYGVGTSDYVRITVPLTSARLAQVTCGSRVESVRINVIPTFQEI